MPRKRNYNGRRNYRHKNNTNFRSRNKHYYNKYVNNIDYNHNNVDPYRFYNYPSNFNNPNFKKVY